MTNPLNTIIRTAVVVLVLIVLGAHNSDSFASGPGGHGCAAGNLIPNCGMDQFAPSAQGQAPVGWIPFVISGGVATDPSPDTFWGAPSLRMWSDGGVFVAGIWTQVGGLTPGATYRASMGWGAPTEPNAFGRRLGIDPTGGTDPNSPNIAWGPMQRGPGKVLNDSNPGYPNIDVTAVARSATLTVFVWVDHNYSTGQNQIFIDAVGLYQDAAPVIALPTDLPPTPAPVQKEAAAPAPTSRPATATIAPTATVTPEPTASATPSQSPMPTDTSTPTMPPTPQDTVTPSVTPSSTLPPRPRATATPAVTAQASSASPPQGLLFGGVGALLSAGVLGVRVMKRRNGFPSGGGE